MCGRIACNLSTESLCQACSYQQVTTENKDSTFVKSVWERCEDSDRRFKPSNNLGPTESIPVLLDASHLIYSGESTTKGSRVLTAMRWGISTSFQKNASTSQRRPLVINCRLEQCHTKPLYAEALRRGQRCVVVCTGYYEWKNCGNSKLPFLFYNFDRSQFWEERAPSAGSEEMWSDQVGWLGAPVTFLAGIFVRNDEAPLFSVVVMTRCADARVSWVHGRMPVLLSSDSDVNLWLCPSIDSRSAISKLAGDSALLNWHRVSPAVNNVRNKDVSTGRLLEGDNCSGDSTIAGSDQDGTPSKKLKRTANFLETWLGVNRK